MAAMGYLAECGTVKKDDVSKDQLLATMLLRLLGVYFVARSIIVGWSGVFRLVLATRLFSFGEAWSYNGLFVGSLAAELAIGIYFFLGGRWVIATVLLPAVPSSSDDVRENSEEERRMTTPPETPQGAKPATKTNVQAEGGWIERRAALLLRLLGVYFTASGIIAAFAEGDRLMSLWSDFALTRDTTFWWDVAMAAHVIVELLIGLYLVLGGQWVYDRILAPVTCRRAKHSISGMSEEVADEGQRGKEERGTNIE